MYILGINAYHPDSSACLIKDGLLIAAVEEERFRRIKHWAGLPTESVRYCLEEGGIGLEDLDYIALNRDPRKNFLKKVIFVILSRPSLSFVKGRISNAVKVRGVKYGLSRRMGVSVKNIKAKVYNIEHHRAHLASSFFVSPYLEATIVSLDGFGDFTSCMVASGKGNKIRGLSQVNYPHSLGIFYTAFTQFLGFNKFGDEFKVMGLAAFGQPKYIDQMQEIIVLKPNGKFQLNLDYFSFYKNKEGMLWDNCEPVLDKVYSDKFIEKFGPARKEEELSAYHCDLAASLQAVYEKALFHVLNYAYRMTGIERLCFSGGCAMNSLANGKIFEHTPFREIFIQPASSDAGGCLGAAYYLYHQLFNQKRIFVMEHAYWGPDYTGADIDAEIKTGKGNLEASGCVIEEFKDIGQLCYNAARHIAEGRIVGWFQGRMELGARALGNRSILVDPRKKEMKDILNERIKKREWFRPFAPSILKEKVDEYFEKAVPDSFMLKVFPIKEDKKQVIPAVVHVDGTGRLQAVGEAENKIFYRLLKEFEKLTGVPILLNTSFNENEPIVCRPQEAMDCFLRTRMDVLVLGNYVIRKPLRQPDA